MDVSIRLTANDFDPGVDGRASCAPARRVRLGRIAVEQHRFAAPSPAQLQVGAGEIVLLTPFAGGVEFADASLPDGASIALPVGTAGFLGRAALHRLTGSPGASCLALRLPRDMFQVSISRRRNQPTRFAAADLVAPAPPALRGMLGEVARAVSGKRLPGEADGLDARLEAALVDAFVEEAAWGALLQTPRAVNQAVAAIRDGSMLEPEALAAVCGVTPRTLREGFAAAFGMSLAAYLLRARLDKAHESLASGYDSRSIPQVARDCGFTTASAFSRAYVRAFGETPTATRSRSVRAAPPPVSRLASS